MKNYSDHVRAVADALMGMNWGKEMGLIAECDSECGAGCTQMVLDGVFWLLGHPKANPKFAGFKGKYGIISQDNGDAHQLRAAIIENNPEATDVMIKTCIAHVMYIHRHGTDKYMEELKRATREPLAMPESELSNG
jgi:hypothetical protein